MRFNSFCLECLDLAVEELLTGRYVGVPEYSHGWKCLLNRLVDTPVNYIPYDDLMDTQKRTFGGVH